MSESPHGGATQDRPRDARQTTHTQPGACLRIALIRHAPTPGNLERRYIGTTDEGLSPVGRELALKARAALEALRPQLLFTSGMRRCDETAGLLFPQLSPIHVAGLAEMRFGAFEGKTFTELAADTRYQAWVDAGCVTACPDGEGQAEFVARVREALERTLDACAAAIASPTGRRPQAPLHLDAAFVVHAGTIMAAMSTLAEPARPYWDWKASYCSGYVAQALRTENGWRLARVQELGGIVE